MSISCLQSLDDFLFLLGCNLNPPPLSGKPCLAWSLLVPLTSSFATCLPSSRFKPHRTPQCFSVRPGPFHVGGVSGIAFLWMFARLAPSANLRISSPMRKNFLTIPVILYQKFMSLITFITTCNYCLKNSASLSVVSALPADCELCRVKNLVCSQLYPLQLLMVCGKAQ